MGHGNVSATVALGDNQADESAFTPLENVAGLDLDRRDRVVDQLAVESDALLSHQTASFGARSLAQAAGDQVNRGDLPVARPVLRHFNVGNVIGKPTAPKRLRGGKAFRGL